jgi:hypothetical protein
MLFVNQNILVLRGVNGGVRRCMLGEREPRIVTT